MSADTNERKKALTQQVIAELKTMLPASKLDLYSLYVDQCFRRVPIEDLSADSPASLAAIVAGQLSLLEQRKAGEPRLRVFNPDPEKDGWDSPHTIVELVNDDMPFLVDTAALTFTELSLDIHLIIHPVVRVSRDHNGVLSSIHSKATRKGHAESVMHFRIDRRRDADALNEVRRHLEKSFGDLYLAIADWRAMETRAFESEKMLPEWAPQASENWMNECQEFMRWLLEDHFVFLGVRDYRVVRGKMKNELQVVPGSGLGILRETRDTVMSRPLASLAEASKERNSRSPLIVTKTNARSTVHRAGYLDYIGVLRFDEKGRTVGERRFLGLFTSMAYNLGAMETPMVRDRARTVLDGSGLVQGSHAWKSMLHILETLPRDELLQASSEELHDMALGVLNLQERQRIRLFIRRERYGRFHSCIVYIPRERFNTENRQAIQDILFRALQGQQLDYGVHVSESPLARLQVVVRSEPGVEIDYDVAALEQEMVQAVRSWTDELRVTLVQRYGESTGQEYATRFARAFPEAYKEDVSPWVAAFDVENAAAVDDGASLRMSLYRPSSPRGGIIRFKIFRKTHPIPLSDVLPMLENLGLRIVNERPYELHLPDEECLWVQDFDMVPAVSRDLDIDAIRERFQQAFEKVLHGETDNDEFNRLVIASELSWAQVKVLRAYCKYLLQTGVPFSASYMAETMAKHPVTARLLVELFEASFDPQRDQESAAGKKAVRQELARTFESLIGEVREQDRVLLEEIEAMVQARTRSRESQVKAIRRAFKRALEAVTILDEDRILHAFYRVIRATLRTNCYQLDDVGGIKEYMSFKIDSHAIPELPRPRPFREIWVYSPSVEGIHLRMGKIARGGLRWSDRREDFRTEVLGLMKAQNVKNTMIVPVGAKGGFVVKRPPQGGDREAILAEGVRCYKLFINGLLDISDNLDKNQVIPPRDVVRRDEDDPYLVVAADKGTATFSDTANGIAAEHDFWLGDAFASGGSAGYDHKGMGITARGAWESVKRHFREMGVNIQKEPFTVVGIGDMSGDVFGNGMQLSRHIRLQAAFNHQHIFLDPNPDEKTSYQERRRLFRMARSGWTDYNADLISSGGGVFSRLQKTIPLSAEVRAWLGVEEKQVMPNELIRMLLKAPVDLLWNGGIGTYVKASGESHASVGDLANNVLRVNGNDLQAKVVGEGGNLGFTQLGRIEFAQAGGFINTDFIDNAAGVDTSDHEVNIKILLNLALRAGKLDAADRNSLLAEMTSDVADLVLRSNYLQAQAISIMEKFSHTRLGSKRHFINVLEDQGLLDRELEYLPSEDEFSERRARGEGLTRPELAVLLSYSKINLYQQLLASDVPEDTWLSDEAVAYFPAALQARYPQFVKEHRLKREIIATQVTNSLVNRMGASFAQRMMEDTEATPGQVARAYTIARELFAARDFWRKVERLDNRVNSDLQIDAMVGMWRLLRRATRWLLNLEGRKLDISLMVERLGPGLKIIEKSIRRSMSDEQKEALAQRTKVFLDGGFPRALSEQTAMLDHLAPALDVVETAARRQIDALRVADVFFGLSDVLELAWLRRQVEALEVHGRWHALSRANLRDELFSQHNRLVEIVLRSHGDEKDSVAAWTEANEKNVSSVRKMLTHMKKDAEMDYPTLSVAVRALGQLSND